VFTVTHANSPSLGWSNKKGAIFAVINGDAVNMVKEEDERLETVRDCEGIPLN
jgi:hypothetical protein